MDRFENMNTFIRVVESGTISAAADKLGVAKSAVSRRLKELEEHLGVELFHRTTRSMNLTDTGRGFYERSARILADLDEAESAAAQEHGELRGTLRVALPLSFGLHHMSAPISEFARRHPKVRFELDLNDRRVDLIEEGADVALRVGRLRDSSLIARKLFDARTVVIASPAYIAEHGAPQTPADLAGHDCLVYSNLPNPRRWVCRDAEGLAHEVEVDAVMSVSSGDFVCEQAIRGHGIAMQPTFIAGEAVARGDLVPLLTDYEWPVTPAWAVYPPTRHLSYRVREFIDFLVDTFAGKPSWDRDCDRIVAGLRPGNEGD